MGLSISHLLVVLVIVLVVFGTKRLKNAGADLGDAIKGFRKAIKEGEEATKSVDSKEDEMPEEEIVNKEKDKT